MSKPQNQSVTIEEAVARLVNLDYIPTGFTLLEMTAAFLEEAEVEYENARIEHLPQTKLTVLETRLAICRARDELARRLFESLSSELDDRDSTMLVVAEGLAGQTRLKLESVADWAAEEYGIGLPDWLHQGDGANDAAIKDMRWEDVTIKIYADYKIGCRFANGHKSNSSFREIGLMGQRKFNPNFVGGILIGLSMGSKYPSTQSPLPKHATAISKLRTALCQLTGLANDPFLDFNASSGWKPRFILVDDRRNADERARARAQHVELDETRDFEIEDDPAGEFLAKNS